jgi:hypothetical protein
MGILLTVEREQSVEVRIFPMQPTGVPNVEKRTVDLEMTSKNGFRKWGSGSMIVGPLVNDLPRLIVDIRHQVRRAGSDQGVAAGVAIPQELDATFESFELVGRQQRAAFNKAMVWIVFLGPSGVVVRIHACRVPPLYIESTKRE